MKPHRSRRSPLHAVRCQLSHRLAPMRFVFHWLRPPPHHREKVLSRILIRTGRESNTSGVSASSSGLSLALRCLDPMARP
ncbi:hypothetical protein GW17_00035348 [Ensete ventricosum]|uniref:Uncharacterized protein n=1 Tax=Ensete ventricosum TaxID=4639 RepID=A0A444DU00_ENSVE|nr:hypothetical protein GW17_00035348 [Ensete ventricosum]RZR70740.1 hypothetical protein BHM03_00001217 [Ensete ventricosum]